MSTQANSKRRTVSTGCHGDDQAQHEYGRNLLLRMAQEDSAEYERSHIDPEFTVNDIALLTKFSPQHIRNLLRRAGVGVRVMRPQANSSRRSRTFVVRYSQLKRVAGALGLAPVACVGDLGSAYLADMDRDYGHARMNGLSHDPLESQMATVGRYAATPLAAQDVDRGHLAGHWTRLSKVTVHNARAIKLGSIGDMTQHQWEAIRAGFGYECAYCGCGDATILEHVVPVSRGGGTTRGNVVLSCAGCNASKKTSDVFTWAASKGYLDRFIQACLSASERWNDAPRKAAA